tara:strand:+ start:31052 stop:31528 length:477 start_codon:yes stop_codon:yes gene_type:complete
MKNSEAISEFLSAMRGFTSTVTVISSKSSSIRLAMTATSVCSLSLDPPSMVICVNKAASIHRALKEKNSFCINVLSKDQLYLAELCSDSTKEDQRFEDGQWNEIDSIPYIYDSTSNIFCKFKEEISYSTHSLFIGKVYKVINNKEHPTLLYKEGNYIK